MAKPFENYFRITLYKTKILNSESNIFPSFKLSFEVSSISLETDKVTSREFDFGSKIPKSATLQSFNITAYNISWLSFSSTLGKISIPLSISKLNDQRQWFYLKNDNDENVLGILTSLYCEVSDSHMINNTLNNIKGNIYPRAELSCENLHSNLINTLLNRTLNAKESNLHGNPSNKVNNTCYLGSCDYTNDRTLQEDKLNIRSPSNNGKSSMNLNIQKDIHPQNHNNGIFSPIHTERIVSFSLRELTNNYSLQSIEAILNQVKDNSFIEGNYPLNNNGEFIEKLKKKVRALNENEDYLNSQMVVNNQLNDKIIEKENILKKERNKLEEKFRKYKVKQAEFETKSLNLAQSNIQFENDQFRFLLEKEIFQQDKDNFININLILSHNNFNDSEKQEECFDSSLIIKSTKIINTEQMGKELLGINRKKKEIIVENASNYNVKSKSKPNSTGSTTNCTSGNNSEVTSYDYQNVFFNTSPFQDTNNNINNTKYFAPIAEINLTNNGQGHLSLSKNEIFNNNPLVDSLEYGISGKKTLPANCFGRSALRKNSKQSANGTSLHLTNEINSNNSRKKSVKNTANPINRKFSIVSNASKGEKCGNITKKECNGIKNETTTNTISSVSNTNAKNGSKLNKKNK